MELTYKSQDFEILLKIWKSGEAGSVFLQKIKSRSANRAQNSDQVYPRQGPWHQYHYPELRWVLESVSGLSVWNPFHFYSFSSILLHPLPVSKYSLDYFLPNAAPCTCPHWKLVPGNSSAHSLSLVSSSCDDVSPAAWHFTPWHREVSPAHVALSPLTPPDQSGKCQRRPSPALTPRCFQLID